MAIEGTAQDEFEEVLKTFLTPARAIRDPEHLKGRAAKLTQIARAFNSPGRHVFIFGDRGVGKTSLAQSAAVLRQSSDKEPITIACDQGTNFFSLVRDMSTACMPGREMLHQRQTERKLALGIPGLSYEMKQGIENGVIPTPTNINEAVGLLRFIAGYHSSNPVVIVDEFDQLSKIEDKKYFADLIKQISDQDIGVRFIFCGIGSSLDELIGTHLSTDRYLSAIPLERLSHDARWEIIETAAEAIRIAVPREIVIRIGQISDGYPYYVHLICEMMFWSIFDDERKISRCETVHFSNGVKGAVADAQTSLRHAYDLATQKYRDDYQEVLWSVADGAMLKRQTSEIYEQSYLRIMASRKGRSALKKEQFYSRMNALKSDRHGRILVGSAAGWYEYRENVVRGYVRLKAEQSGVELGVDHH